MSQGDSKNNNIIIKKWNQEVVVLITIIFMMFILSREYRWIIKVSYGTYTKPFTINNPLTLIEDDDT